MQTLNASDGTQGQCEAISTGSCSMSLPRKARGSTRARRLQEAGGLGREAEVRLAQVQLARIVISRSIPISIFLALCGIWGIGDWRRDGEFCGDLLERGLRVGETKLMAEER